MRLRSLAVLCCLLAAAIGPAYLNQAWNKTLPSNTFLTDLAVDSAGNTIVVSGGASGLIYVRKVSPTGIDLWTVVIQDPTGGSTPRSLALDAAGSIFVEAINYGTDILTLRKLRATDGAVLGSVNMPGPIWIQPSNSDVVVDSANNVYWVATQIDEDANQLALVVANINSGSLPASTFRTHRMPAQTNLLKVGPRPGGGVMVLAGIPVEPGLGDFLCTSTLYSFGPSGLPSQTNAGFAGAFAQVPNSSDIVFAGGRLSTAGYLNRHRIQLDGASGLSRTQALGSPIAFFRDLHVTKSGIGVAVGGMEATNNSKDSVIVTFRSGDLSNGGKLQFLTPDVIQFMTSVRGDAYDTVTCLEMYDLKSFRIMEVDALTGLLLQTRTYTQTFTSTDTCHSVNSAGFIAIGMGNRIVGLKPRDLKDIYMGNTTYQGGTNATAIIRMYDTHTASRTVTLSDGGSPYVTIAASKVIDVGQTQVSATVLTNPVPSTQNITLTAKYGSQTRTFAFTLTP